MWPPSSPDWFELEDSNLTEGTQRDRSYVVMRSLVTKVPHAVILRDMFSLAAERSMEMEVGCLTALAKVNLSRHRW